MFKFLLKINELLNIRSILLSAKFSANTVINVLFFNAPLNKRSYIIKVYALHRIEWVHENKKDQASFSLPNFRHDNLLLSNGIENETLKAIIESHAHSKQIELIEIVFFFPQNQIERYVCVWLINSLFICVQIYHLFPIVSNNDNKYFKVILNCMRN
jgi:hypothetical protein